MSLLSQSMNAQIVENIGTIPVKIPESSGVAASRTFEGILWTHNDSGHRPLLYAITLSGDIVAELAVPGASMRDWEDIAIGSCPSVIVTTSGYCIYIADTGDNLERRQAVRLYVLPEPNPRTPAMTETEPAIEINFRYPNGAVDVEGIGVDPSGIVWLVTKGRRWPIELYSLDLEPIRSLPPATTLEAVAVDTLSLPRVPLAGWVTAAAVSPSGNRLVIRTYVDIYFYDRTRDGRWIPAPPDCHIGAIEPQGEAIDFLDEGTLVLTSETLPNRPGPIHRVICE